MPASARRPMARSLCRPHGGVNAIALAPLNGFVPRFGVPAETTLAEARAVGLEPVVVADPALALDVDSPEDYELLLASA